ncbi:MAG: enoyl-CoA hydratase/isomerase family protein [Candidatus Binatia bacterium]
MSRRRASRAAAHSAGALLAVRNGIARIDLPHARVAPSVAQRICDAAEQIAFDETVRVAVLRGAPPAFCLGVEPDGDGGPDWIAAIADLTVPVIVALDGGAIAEGAELALAGDIRIAGPRAFLAFPQVSGGRLPRHGATQRLPRLIGRTRAMELLLSGRRAGAREALRIGLVTAVAPSPAVAARRLATALAAKGPVALRLAKEAVVRSGDLPLADGLRLEQDLYVLLQTTEDRAEGVRAFLSGRRPRFRGR